MIIIALIDVSYQMNLICFVDSPVSQIEKNGLVALNSYWFTQTRQCTNVVTKLLFYPFIIVQALFEGLKAYRTEDGNILLFRPEENGKRMINGAERMCMPAPSVDQFVQAVKATVLANERWVMHLQF